MFWKDRGYRHFWYLRVGGRKESRTFLIFKVQRQEKKQNILWWLRCFRTSRETGHQQRPRYFEKLRAEKTWNLVRLSFELLNRDICRKEKSFGHGLSEPIFERKRENLSGRFLLAFEGSKQRKHALYLLAFRGHNRDICRKRRVERRPEKEERTTSSLGMYFEEKKEQPWVAPQPFR